MVWVGVYCTWSRREVLDEVERYTAGSCLLPLCCESWRGETTPSIYAERRGERRNVEERDKRYMHGTDRHTIVDRHQLVSKCFPLGLHTSCDAVTLSITECPLTPLSCVFWYPSCPYLLWWLSCWGWVQLSVSPSHLALSLTTTEQGQDRWLVTSVSNGKH